MVALDKSRSIYMIVKNSPLKTLGLSREGRGRGSGGALRLLSGGLGVAGSLKLRSCVKEPRIC